MSAEPFAKSNPPQTLHEHTLEVYAAVEQLTAALSLSLSEVVPEGFTEMLRYAALFHDLGKAASGFQDMVTAPKDKKAPSWEYRHEALSAVLLLATGLHDRCDSRLLFSVLTHHRTLDDRKLAPIFGKGLDREYFDMGEGVKWRRKVAELALHWTWLVDFLKTAQDEGRLPPLPASPPGSPQELRDLHEAGNALDEILTHISDITLDSLPWILARGLLMAGDHLASAGLIGPLTALDGGKVRAAEGFQKRIQAVEGCALLEAPTGAGKTEAALHWALANRRGGERIFYVLPYQASINKMAERLQALFGEENIGILHHRAALQEFARHFDGSNYEAASRTARKRMDQTEQFYRPIKVLTPYQLLKLMFGCRFFEIGLAELLGGLVIFDEVHAYDAHVAALIEISVHRLRRMSVRFLFMSATFPDFLQKRLQNALGTSHIVTVEGSDPRAARLLRTARHRLHLHACRLEDMMTQIVADALAGRKVLVVCNRVAQAQEIYRSLLACEALHGKRVDLLHSRFISKDRMEKEKRLSAFPDSLDIVQQQVPAADILVSTQVVEVSLNVSFDVVYTEIAPVDALLQRFGRVNRLNQHGCPVPVHVATQFEEKAVKHVYSLERIEATCRNVPDGCELFASVEREWVERAYEGGYTVEEQQKYDTARSSFESTLQNLRPGYSGSDADFYDLFDNYNVVPIRFKHLYQKAIQEKRYFDAAGFIAGLSSATFSIMREPVDYDETNHVYYVDRRYDAELGLLNEPETERSFEREAAYERIFG